MKIHTLRTFAAALVLASIVIAPSLRAASGTWSSTASSGNWSDTTNWSGGTLADGVGATATLNTNITAATTVTIDTTSRTLGILNIGDTNNTHAFTLASSGGATLIMDNGGAGAQINQLSTSKGDTISADIVLNDTTTLANASANTFTLSGVISGSSGLALNSTGSGTVRLTGANTYSGGTTLKSGTLSVGNGSALGSGTITLGDASNTGAAVSLVHSATAAASSTFTNNIIVTGTGTASLTTSGWGATFSGSITLNRDLIVGTTTGNSLALSGVVSGSGGLIINNGGSSSISNLQGVTLSAANTYSGGTVVKAGLLTVTSATSAGSGTITLGDAANTGAVVYLRAVEAGTITNAINVVGTGAATLGTTGSNPTFSGPITLARDLTLSTSNNSGSQLTISGAITGTGNLTTYTDGTGSTASRVILSGSINNSGSITVTAGSVINNTTTARGTLISGVIGSNVTDIIETNTTSGGVGWLTLTGSGNAFTGKVDIQGGILRLGSGASTTTATFLTDTTSLYLYTTNSSGLYLNFASNSVLETITGLYIDGVAQSAGTWGAVGSGAQFENALITGTGILNVTGSAIPEPATCALLAGTAILSVALLRRRRR